MMIMMMMTRVFVDRRKKGRFRAAEGSSGHAWKENSKFESRSFPFTTYAMIRFHLAYVGSVR